MIFVKRFYTRPILLHLKRDLIENTFVYLEGILLEVVFVYCLNFPQLLNRVEGNIVRFDVMWIAENQEILILPSLLICLIRIEPFSPFFGRFDMAYLTDELIPFID